MQASPSFVHYLPILTTVLSAVFFVLLVRRAHARRWAPHLVWWAAGVFFYGLGTTIESTITLSGNTPGLFRVWYWAGAILGGYPLATGSVYLLCSRRLAHTLTAITFGLVVFASVAVFLSPVDPAAIDPVRPSGKALEWQWIRALTPVINLYAAAFLIGGAVHSSFRFVSAGSNPGRALGTALIAIGGMLPGFGGMLAKLNIVEALYVGELVGLILIWSGYECCVRAPEPVRAETDLVGRPGPVPVPEGLGGQTH